ncbi:MAG TPA: hypothetical protein VH208_13485 [Myxococcaceae bacterium]|nr:hypothetical protein [Myxococcaceae bacterium]
MVQQYFRYTYGRQEDATKDGCALEGMRQGMVGQGGTLLQMFASTASQKPFQTRQVQ